MFLNDSKAQNWLIFTVEVGATNGRLSLLSRRSTRVPTSTKGLFERFFGTKTTFSAVSSLLCTLFHSPASDKRWRRDSTFPLSYVHLCGTTQCLKINVKVVEKNWNTSLKIAELLKITEICGDLQRIAENCWGLLRFAEVYWYSLILIEICWDYLIIAEIAEIYWDLLRYTENCWDWLRIAEIFEIYWDHWNLLRFDE